MHSNGYICNELKTVIISQDKIVIKTRSIVVGLALRYKTVYHIKQNYNRTGVYILKPETHPPAKLSKPTKR